MKFCTALVLFLGSAVAVHGAGMRGPHHAEHGPAHHEDFVHDLHREVPRVMPDDLARLRDKEGHPGRAGHLPPSHSRHLTGSEKYTYNSLGASVNADWLNTGCDYGSSVSLSAYNTASKYVLDGVPTTTNEAYAYFSMDSWSDCDGTTASHTTIYVDVYGGNSDGNLVIDDDLQTASYSANANSTMTTEECTKVCGPSDDDYGDDDGNYCYYGNCTMISSESCAATIEATWEATTAVPSNSSSASKYEGADYKTHSSAKGQDRFATATLVVVVDGASIDIPDDANFTGYIQQSNSTDTYTYS